MDKVGISYWGGMTANDVIECTRVADKRGLASAWMAEGHGGDAFAIMAACALSTNKIRLGTSIVSIYVRSAPTIALGAATVDSLSKGRFILGLGTSHQAQVEPEHGLVFEKPVGRMRETLAVVRGLLQSSKISYKGKIFPQIDFDYWFEPFRKRIPVYVAAVFPKMIDFCGRFADGTITVWHTVNRSRESAEILKSSAKKAGRKASEVELAALIPTCVSEDAEAAIEGMKRLVAFYCGFFPRYNRLMSESGFAKEAAMIRTAWVAGKKEESYNMVTEKMTRTLGIAGELEECPRRLEEYHRAGVGTPILFPTATVGKKRGKDTVKEVCIDAIKAAS
jgi:alkanesulfonate monooxygenase SsuD/methylene tetrahydromethanopterin reductase-like flavin-dependent oxidoreductase (luciferase family)